MLRTLCEPNAAVTIDSFSKSNLVRVSKFASLWLLKIYRTIPAVLERLRRFVIPICALDQSDCEARVSFTAPLDQVAQIGLRISQIRLHDDPDMRPIFELVLRQNSFEELKSGIFVRITLHIEIDKRSELYSAAQKRPQLRREMRNCVGRIGRIHL